MQYLNTFQIMYLNTFYLYLDTSNCRYFSRCYQFTSLIKLFLHSRVSTTKKLIIYRQVQNELYIFPYIEAHQFYGKNNKAHSCCQE